jgi:hypothetical protein
VKIIEPSPIFVESLQKTFQTPLSIEGLLRSALEQDQALSRCMSEEDSSGEISTLDRS